MIFHGYINFFLYAFAVVGIPEMAEEGSIKMSSLAIKLVFVILTETQFLVDKFVGYPALANIVLKTLLPFPTIYGCELVFLICFTSRLKTEWTLWKMMFGAFLLQQLQG
jgi:hypothetical protein